MNFEVKIIEDSVSPAGKRLTTITATYPRFIHCYSADTDVLCEIDGVREFVPWPNVQTSARLAAFNADGTIVFESPTSWVNEQYDGEMVYLAGHERLSFCVTPNHRMYVGSRKKERDEWEIILASELAESTQKRFRCSGEVKDGTPISELLSTFVGFFVGDGTYPKAGRKAVFHLKKKRKIEFVCDLLRKLSIEFTVHPYDDGTCCIRFPKMQILADCYAIDGQKTIPKEIMCSEPVNMLCFMRGLWNSDGSTDKAECQVFNTSSPHVANRLCALAAMSGQRINVNPPYDSGVYKLQRMTEDEPILRKDKHTIDWVPYSGKVYCATVSTGLLVVRHKGRVIVSGNSEIMTHRDRARNAASSRAIPWPKMSEMVREHPVIPIKWGMEQSGMQTGDEIPEKFRELAQDLWLSAMRSAASYADMIHNIGRTSEELRPGTLTEEEKKIKIHKSLPNRIVEPWMWITVVMTATEWKNFFRLRCHPDAEVHFQKIACMIRDALAESTPVERTYHMPFIQDDERTALDQKNRTIVISGGLIDQLCKISTARCARVSYLTHEGTRSQEKDLELFDRLCQGSGFGHWSPHEHIAFADEPSLVSGPFRGWEQYRKFFGNENEPG